MATSGIETDFENLAIGDKRLSADALNQAAADSFESFMTDLSIGKNSNEMYEILMTLSKAHASSNHEYDEKKKEAMQMLDYKQPVYQAAYLYLYFPTICHTIREALEKAKVKEEKTVFQYLIESIDAKTLHVCSVGGGPGTDVLALYRYMEKNIGAGKQVKINATVLDKCKDWEKSWKKLSASLKENGSKNIMMTYEAYDIADVNSNPTGIKEADIILMIKFFSVLTDKNGRTALKHNEYENNLSKIFNSAKPGSLLVIGDNDTKIGSSQTFNLILSQIQTIAERSNFVLCDKINIKNPGHKVLDGDNNPLESVRDSYCLDSKGNKFYFQKNREMDFVIMRKKNDVKQEDSKFKEGSEAEEPNADNPKPSVADPKKNQHCFVPACPWISTGHTCNICERPICPQHFEDYKGRCHMDIDIPERKSQKTETQSPFWCSTL